MSQAQSSAPKTLENVVVVGAGGRVGFGLSLVVADCGYNVSGLDINPDVIRTINQGKVPFREKGASEVLSRVLQSGRLHMTLDPEVVALAKVVIVIPGTPIDEHHNPDLRPLTKAIDEIAPYLRSGQLVILRSTVSPGATQVVRSIIANASGLVPEQDFEIVFAPERVVEGQALEEIRSIPQILGAFSERGFARGEAFFSKFNQHPCIRVTPTEAELAKLMCNMYRYAQFALANEFYLIADSFGVDAHRVLDACKMGYSRAPIPRPGPNVGGPCLTKDAWFLLEGMPFANMVSVAFQVNEGMTAQIVKKLTSMNKVHRVGILGLTFKPESDDIRNSLSFKLKKQLIRQGITVVAVDPYVSSDPMGALAGVDALVLMTPHMEYRNLTMVHKVVNNLKCLYCDIWGYWRDSVPAAESGYFFGYQVPFPVEAAAVPTTDLMLQDESPGSLHAPAEIAI